LISGSAKEAGDVGGIITWDAYRKDGGVQGAYPCSFIVFRKQ